MAKCDVNLSFSALVVNIDRPWLYAELFNDFEIDIGGDAKYDFGFFFATQIMSLLNFRETG